MEDFQEFSKQLTNQSHTDQILEQLKVKFAKLSAIEDKHLFNQIYQHNLYEINPLMIDLIIRFSAERRERSLTGLEIGQFTFLRQFEDEKILTYINSHIVSYITNVLLKLEGNTEESENTMLAILNNQEVPKEIKIEVVTKQTTKIQALTNVQDPELWTELLHILDKVVPTWHNVTLYFEHVGELDPVLADFLNLPGNFEILEKELVANDTDIAADNVSAFYSELITSNLLADAALEHLIKSMPHTFTEIDLSGVSDYRVDLLLRNNFLEMNQENYDLLKASHNGKNIEFLEFFAENSPDWWSDITFDSEDYQLLFKSKVFTLADKFIIAESMPLEILDESSQVADLLSQLYANSSQTVPDTLFNAVISSAPDEELKVQMILQQNANFSTERYKEVMQLLGTTYKAILDEPKLAKLPNTTYNLELAQVLDNRNIISSVTGKHEANLRLNMFQKDK